MTFFIQGALKGATSRYFVSFLRGRNLPLIEATCKSCVEKEQDGLGLTRTYKIYVEVFQMNKS